MEKEQVVIQEMPDKETLEKFVLGVMGGEHRVIFNIELGKFVGLVPCQ